MSATLAIDALAEEVRKTDPDNLPLAGKVWTLRIEDDEIVLRIRMAREPINGQPVRREPPPKQDPKPKDPPPAREDRL